MATTDQGPTQIWLVEDNRAYRRALESVVAEDGGMECALAVPSCEDALAALDAGGAPDVVLMDIGLPGMSGIEGVRRIRSLSPATSVLMLTVHEDDGAIFEAICAGASGYLLKPSAAADVIAAIRQVRRGGVPITPQIARRVLAMFARLAPPRDRDDDYGLSERERDVLQLLVEGLTMQQIADRLTVSYHTIDTHIRNIYAKLHVRSRALAVAKAVSEGLL